jgi:hypothetical protein
MFVVPVCTRLNKPRGFLTRVKRDYFPSQARCEMDVIRLGCQVPGAKTGHASACTKLQSLTITVAALLD